MKLENFEGIQMRLCDYWFNYIPLNIENPINYLEIGTLNGANLFSVADYYGKHSDSKLYCIDPWDDYEDYCEYKNIQDKHFDIFLRNLNNRSDKNKITYYKNYSHKILPTLEDDYFDIIYIDGNHGPDYVLEDAVLSFRKLKKNGYLIFDDYVGWDDSTKIGIDAFLRAYDKKYKLLGTSDTQLLLQKI